MIYFRGYRPALRANISIYGLLLEVLYTKIKSNKHTQKITHKIG